MFTLIVLITLIAIHALIVMLAGLYTIVPADCADVVIQKGRMRVFSPHREYNPTGKMLAAIGVSNQGAMTSILNRLARPNDLGFSEFGGIVEGVKDAKATKNAKDAKDQKT